MAAAAASHVAGAAVVVAVTGPSNAGKSQLSAAMAAAIPHALVVAQDDFYKNISLVPTLRLADEVDVADWDSAGALDLTAMAAAVQERIASPADFCHCCGVPAFGAAQVPLTEHHVVIVEGTLALDLPLGITFDHVFVLDAAFSLCAARRAARL